MENQNTAEGRLEKLEQQARQCLMESKDSIFTDYLQKLLPRIQSQKVQVDLLQAELDRSYEMYQTRRRLAEPVAEAPTAEVIPESKPMASDTTMEEPVTEAEAKASRGKSAEYVIATVALSVVGGAFILTALVMLGMNFMNGLVKGLCLYAGAAIVLLLSELFLYRRWPKLGTAISTVGIGAFYISTMVNYLSLHNFGIWTTLAITIVITIAVTFWSCRRDNLIYRLLGLASCYLCLFPLSFSVSFTNEEMLVLMAIFFAMNIICMVAPVQKLQTVSHVIHLICNTIALPWVMYRLQDKGLPLRYQLVVLVMFVVLLHVLLIVQTMYQRKVSANGGNASSAGVLTVYGIQGLVTAITASVCIITTPDFAFTEVHVATAAIVLICVTAMLLLRKGTKRWSPYYFLCAYSFLVYFIVDEAWENVICLTALLVVSKILSCLKQPALKVCDAVITTIYCVNLLGYSTMEEPYSYVLLAGTIFSIFFVNQWATYQEILLTFSLGLYASITLLPMLRLPVFSGILFVSVLLFNNVKRMRDPHIRVFNVLALAGQVIAFLLLINPVYRNAYITYLCMLVFGLAVIELTFQDKYYKDFKHKELILAIFLTYMAFIIKTNLPVLNSIMLMVIALAGVGIGFVRKDKPIRIYGLTLSLVVCGKIVLYDYFGIPTLQKTVLFLVIGIIALMIAGIYIVLEKKSGE